MATPKTDDCKQPLEFNQLNKWLRNHIWRLINDFKVIDEDTKPVVCLSEWEGFFAMLSLLMMLQGNTLIKFEQVALDIVQMLSHPIKKDT